MAKDDLRSLGLVVSAIKKLSEAQGSTKERILNYLSAEYGYPKESIKRPVTIRAKSFFLFFVFVI